MWAEPAVTSAPTSVRGRDQVFAAVVLVVVTVEPIGRPDLGWRPVAGGLGCVLAAAVLVRRTHGLAAVVLAFGAFVIADMAAFVLGAKPVVLYSGGSCWSSSTRCSDGVLAARSLRASCAAEGLRSKLAIWSRQTWHRYASTSLRPNPMKTGLALHVVARMRTWARSPTSVGSCHSDVAAPGPRRRRGLRSRHKAAQPAGSRVGAALVIIPVSGHARCSGEAGDRWSGETHPVEAVT